MNYRANAPYEICVIEDNPSDVTVLTALAPQTLGECTFVVFTDGEEASDYINARGNHSQRPIPQLFLLDLNLPRKSGAVLLAEIRMNPSFSQVPVVVLSGSSNPHDATESRRLGANAYIVKPFELSGYNSVFALIQNLLRIGN